MIALLWVVLAILASPFKSKSRLGAENAALRRQLIVLRRNVHSRVRLTRSLILCAALSMVPIGPAGSYDRPSRDAHRVASGRLSLLLALEVASNGRASAD